MNKCIHILEIDLVNKKKEIIEYINNHFNLIYNCTLCQLEKHVFYCLENNCNFKLCDEYKHYLEHYEKFKHYIYFNLFSSEIWCIKCDKIIEIDYNYEKLENIEKKLNYELIYLKRNIIKEIRINYLKSKNFKNDDFFGTFNYYDNNNYIECSFYFLYGIEYLRECFLKIYYNEIQLFNKTKNYANSKIILIISKIIYQIENKIKIDENLLDEFKKIIQNFIPKIKNSSNIPINNFIDILLNLIHKKLQIIQFYNQNFNIEDKNESLINLYLKNILKDDSIIIKCFNCIFEIKQYCNNCNIINESNKYIVNTKIKVLEKSKFKNIDKLKINFKLKSKRRIFFNSKLIRSIF